MKPDSVSAGGSVALTMWWAFPFAVAPGDRFVIPFGAYFDDSGSHDNSKFVVVGGYVSTPERWAAFDAEWRRELASLGLARFHAADCSNGAPPFDKWDRGERKAIGLKFISIINKHVEFSVSASIQRKVFAQCVKEEHRARMGGPYGVAALACGLNVFRGMRSIHPDARAAFFYDSGTRGRGEVLKTFEEGLRTPSGKADPHFRVNSITFVNSVDYTPIQAADILAYEVYRCREAAILGKPIRHRYLSALRESNTHGMWSILGKDELAGVGEMFDRGPLSIEQPVRKPQKKRGGA